jgi:L-asparaginase
VRVNDLPILVLTTGGTIDKSYFDALSRYQIVDTLVPRLLEVARVLYPFKVEEVTRKDSLDFTDQDRGVLVSRVRQAHCARIVITHGTDTMTLTASALMAIPEKTIVLVGALIPARFSESDAAFNLGMAFATAQTGTPGVYITMNGTVFEAGEVVKDRGQNAFVHAGR